MSKIEIVRNPEPDQKEKLVLIYMKETWGSFTQYDSVYTVVIDPNDLSQKMIFDQSLGLEIIYEKRDNSRNLYRKAYIKAKELAKLEQKILKFFYDYSYNGRRKIAVVYYAVINSKLVELRSVSLRDSKGFYDRVILPNGKILKVRRDSIEIDPLIDGVKQ